jgi:hypothetical protein
MLRRMLGNLVELRRLIVGNDTHETLQDLYDRVCYRLDLFALVITQALNIGLFIFWATLTSGEE